MPSNNLLTQWGQNLTRVRQAMDLSIGELARRTGAHKSHLARFERGEAGLGDDMRIRVAAEVGQQVADLFPYPDTTTETACPSAADAPDGAPSPTPATSTAVQSPAPNAAVPAPSALEGSHDSE